MRGTQPDAMLAVKRSAGITPEDNLMNSTQVRKQASEGYTLALKLRVDATLSPIQGYQWSHKKNMCSTKINLELFAFHVKPPLTVFTLFYFNLCFGKNYTF